MVDSRYATALVGIALSLLVSVLAWWYLNTLLFFLLVPFVPLVFRRGGTERGTANRRAMVECPTCGFSTSRSDFEYCPRDGSRLQSATTGGITRSSVE